MGIALLFGQSEEVEIDERCDIVVADTIRIPPEAVDPTIKNYGRLDFSALLEAYDKEARYAVLLDGEGNVTKDGWNIFALDSGHLISPDEGVQDNAANRR